MYQLHALGAARSTILLCIIGISTRRPGDPPPQNVVLGRELFAFGT
jgi:hypothetical protein